MSNSNYQIMADFKKDAVLRFKKTHFDVVLCPDMGGRIFAEINGISPHRIDLETVKNPDKPFNNYGGGNVWPAPEGGKFGFNYRGSEWYVQSAINTQPFAIIEQKPNSAMLRKEMKLTNRLGIVVETAMTRKFSLLVDIPQILKTQPVKCALSYETIDAFEVINRVSVEEALLAAWTLEQFQATDNTISFVCVNNSRSAINFDFYDHPGRRIAYYTQGFTYKTDGQAKGQIGIRQSSHPSMIGFYDLSRNLLCIRQKVNPDTGLFFNIADNDQPQGPYSAADNYSIFNSDPDMAAFELETIGSARVENDMLKGSELISHTTLAVFEKSQDLENFVSNLLGQPV
jgi:hypothetical protein